MFKIGDFSRLCQVPVSALRYYDEMGLLKPASVDQFTGYRYYRLDQLPRLNRILALKDLGLSLEQIAQLLDKTVPSEQIRGMLRLKQAELQQRVQEEQARLIRVEARLTQIESEDKMPDYEVVLKPLHPLHVLSVREVVPTVEQVGRLFQETMTALRQAGVSLSEVPFCIYHDEDFEPANMDIEIAYPIAAASTRTIPLAGGRALVGHDLPAVACAACTVHHGSYATLTQAYTAIGQWITANGYRIIAPPREIYLRCEPGAEPVTEIQFPVEKAAFSPA